MASDKPFYSVCFSDLTLLVAISWLGLALFLPALAGAGQPEADRAVSGPDGKIPAFEAHLYFGAEDGPFLRAEQARLEPDQDPVISGRRLLEALIDGPRGGGRPVLDKQTKVRTFFIRADGTAYVDLDSTGLKRREFSALSELLAVYAIVDTLIVNLDSVDAVKILLDGKETLSLAGHVDISRPLVADMMWVR